MSELLDVRALARRYRRSPRTIYRWLREGKLLEPTLAISHRRRICFWSEDDLKEWESGGGAFKRKSRRTESNQPEARDR